MLWYEREKDCNNNMYPCRNTLHTGKNAWYINSRMEYFYLHQMRSILSAQVICKYER